MALIETLFLSVNLTPRIPVAGNKIFWNYETKQNYKTRILKKFSELLEMAFETMKE